MTLGFLYKRMGLTLLIALLGLSASSHISAWGPTVTTEVSADNASKVVDAVLQKQIENFGKTGTALSDRTIQSLCTKFEHYYPQIKQDGRVFADHIFNEMRLVPVYAVGTTCMIASINMYWQALNDYLNSTETEPEAVQAAHKKIFRKIKAGLVFSALGVATMYKSHALAQLFTGYTPEQA